MLSYAVARVYLDELNLCMSAEVVTRMCSIKMALLKFLKISQENTCARVFFSIKLQILACNLIKKETLTQVFSFEFC